MKDEDFARWMREEHCKVEELATRLKEQIAYVPKANPAKWIEGLQEAFDHFRAHLIKHMALEETDGYMESVAERRPALSREIERLLREHASLSKIMNGIRQTLLELRPEQPLLIRDCCQRIRDLMAYNDQHDDNENLIVMSAFTDDIGTGD